MDNNYLKRILALLLSIIMLVGILPMQIFAAVEKPNWDKTVDELPGRKNVWEMGPNQSFIDVGGADENYPMLELVYKGKKGEYAHFKARLSGSTNNAWGYNFMLRADESLENTVSMTESYFSRNGNKYKLTQESVDDKLIGRIKIADVFSAGYSNSKPPIADFYLKVGNVDLNDNYILQGRFYKGNVGSEQILNYGALTKLHNALKDKDPYKFYTSTYSFSGVNGDSMNFGVPVEDIPWTNGNDQVWGINTFYQLDNINNKLRVFYVWRGIQGVGANNDFSNISFTDENGVNHNYNIGFRIAFSNDFYDVLRATDGIVYVGNNNEREVNYVGRYTQIGQNGHTFNLGTYPSDNDTILKYYRTYNAVYKDKVVQKDPRDDDYVKLTFNANEGTFDGTDESTKELWALKGKTTFKELLEKTRANASTPKNSLKEWQIDGASIDYNTIIDSEKTLDAVYTDKVLDVDPRDGTNYFKLTINPNGGQVSPNAVWVKKNAKVKFGEIKKQLSANKDGAKFYAWSETSNGSTLIADDKVYTANKTIFPIYKDRVLTSDPKDTINYVKLTFDTSGGNVASKTLWVLKDETAFWEAKIKVNSFISDYTVKDWSLDNKIISDDTKFSTDTTVKANYTDKVYSNNHTNYHQIFFNPKEGTIYTGSISATNTKPLYVLDNDKDQDKYTTFADAKAVVTARKPGAVFVGWQDCDGNFVSDDLVLNLKTNLDDEHAMRGLVGLKNATDYNGGSKTSIGKTGYATEGAFNQRILTTDKLTRGNQGNFTTIDIGGRGFSVNASDNLYKANWDDRHIGIASAAPAPVANMFEFNIDPVKFREKYYDDNGNYNGNLVFRNSLIFNEGGTDKIIELDKSASYASGTGESTQYNAKVDEIFTNEFKQFTGYTRYKESNAYYKFDNEDGHFNGTVKTSLNPESVYANGEYYDAYKFLMPRPNTELKKDMGISFAAEELGKLPSKEVIEQVQSKVKFDLNGGTLPTTVKSFEGYNSPVAGQPLKEFDYNLTRISVDRPVVRIAPLNMYYSNSPHYKYSGFSKDTETSIYWVAPGVNVQIPVPSFENENLEVYNSTEPINASFEEDTVSNLSFIEQNKELVDETKYSGLTLTNPSQIIWSLDEIRPIKLKVQKDQFIEIDENSLPTGLRLEKISDTEQTITGTPVVNWNGTESTKDITINATVHQFYSDTDTTPDEDKIKPYDVTLNIKVVRSLANVNNPGVVNVIPQKPGEEKPENVPDNYVKVEFVPVAGTRLANNLVTLKDHNGQPLKGDALDLRKFLTEEPTKYGKQFLGWSTQLLTGTDDEITEKWGKLEVADSVEETHNEDKTYKFTENSPIKGEITVYAVYGKPAIRLHSNFDKDTTTEGLQEDVVTQVLTNEALDSLQNGTLATEITQKLNSVYDQFKKAGYSLVGFSRDPNATEPDKNETGEGLSKDLYLRDGDEFQLADEENGYEFDVKKGLDLYAVWKKDFDITASKEWLDSQGQTLTDTDKYNGKFKLALIGRPAVGTFGNEVVVEGATYQPIQGTIKDYNGQEITWDNIKGYDKIGRRMSYLVVEIANDAAENAFNSGSATWTDYGIKITEPDIENHVYGHKEQVVEIGEADQIDTFTAATSRLHKIADKPEGVNPHGQGEIPKVGYFDTMGYVFTVTNKELNIAPPTIEQAYDDDTKVVVNPPKEMVDKITVILPDGTTAIFKKNAAGDGYIATTEGTTTKSLSVENGKLIIDNDVTLTENDVYKAVSEKTVADQTQTSEEATMTVKPRLISNEPIIEGQGKLTDKDEVPVEFIVKDPITNRPEPGTTYQVVVVDNDGNERKVGEPFELTEENANDFPGTKATINVPKRDLNDGDTIKIIANEPNKKSSESNEITIDLQGPDITPSYEQDLWRRWSDVLVKLNEEIDPDTPVKVTYTKDGENKELEFDQKEQAKYVLEKLAYDPTVTDLKVVAVDKFGNEGEEKITPPRVDLTKIRIVSAQANRDFLIVSAEEANTKIVATVYPEGTNLDKYTRNEYLELNDATLPQPKATATVKITTANKKTVIRFKTPEGETYKLQKGDVLDVVGTVGEKGKDGYKRTNPYTQVIK